MGDSVIIMESECTQYTKNILYLITINENFRTTYTSSIRHNKKKVV